MLLGLGGPPEMSTFSLIHYVKKATDRDQSHITDLDILTVGGQTRLYATTLYDGHISSWNIDGTSLSRLQTDAFAGPLQAGGTSTLNTITLSGGGVGLLTGGGSNGVLQVQQLQGNGSFSSPTNLNSVASSLTSLHHGETLTLGNGNQAVYGGLAGADGIGRLIFSSNGTYLSQTLYPDQSQTYADNVTATASATVGGNQYLFTASGTEHGVTLWGVANNGNIVQRDNVGNAQGLWISAPSVMETATVGGKTFLIVGSAGSSSLSVMQVGADNSLTIRDHMLDTQDSRFAGVAAMEVLTHHGQTYVIVGGSDDGISVFVLLPGGQLVARGHLADTTAMGLANVSAITAKSSGNGIDIFVASASEFGITRLRLDTGPAGVTLDAPGGGGSATGGAGNDILSGLNGDDVIRGGGGEDVLRDGAGTDMMVGGAGADIFVLAHDNAVDRINDFEVGIDRIDLSGWPTLRSTNQLTMAMTASGMTITYGDEVLIVRSSTNTTIDHRLLTNADLIGGTRIPQVILPGYAGPNLPPPTLPGSYRPDAPQSNNTGPVTGSNLRLSFANPRFQPANDVVRLGKNGNDKLSSGGGNDRLYGRAGNDRLDSGAGSDRLYGGTGNDLLLGRTGVDRIDAGRGADKVAAGGGHDIVFGGGGNDTLNGGTGDDQVLGQAGDDRILGDRGNDRLDGGSGTNKVYGQGGNDKVAAGSGRDFLYGGGGNDLVLGRPGNDRLEGGTGHDRLLGGGGNDKLIGQTGNDHLEGANGNDTLFGGGGNDKLIGQQDKDRIDGGNGKDQLFGGGNSDTLFGRQDKDFLHGGPGNDRLFGGGGHDTLIGDIGNDRLEGGTGHDKLIGGGGADVLVGHQDHDTLDGGNGNDRLYGGGGNDTLLGQAGNDRLEGGEGNDDLIGGQENDTLLGHSGDDTLKGGAGNDVLQGGGGVDMFVFNTGADHILDFEANVDRIVLETDLWDGVLATSDITFLYGTLVGNVATLDFGDGNILVIDGVTALSQVSNAIDYM